MPALDGLHGQNGFNPDETYIVQIQHTRRLPVKAKKWCQDYAILVGLQAIVQLSLHYQTGSGKCVRYRDVATHARIFFRFFILTHTQGR